VAKSLQAVEQSLRALGFKTDPGAAVAAAASHLAG
jgi:hypothetical protein